MSRHGAAGVLQLDSEPPSFADDREPRHRWLLLLLLPLPPPPPPSWNAGFLMQQLLLVLLILESAPQWRCGRFQRVEKRRRHWGAQRTCRACPKVLQKERRACRGARKSQTRGSMLGREGKSIGKMVA